jgi:hypothetical protein
MIPVRIMGSAWAMDRPRHRSMRMKRIICGLLLSLGVLGMGCQTVERTITGKPRVERPVEVVYRFDNVKRTPAVNEWDSIRRILYLHAKGSVSVSDANQRRYDQTDLRDYTARFTIPDASHIAKLNEEIDALDGKEVGGERLRFAMTRAEIGFSGDNLSTPQDAILRGVTLPAASLRLFPKSGMVETQTDQYGAWAKRVSVASGEDYVYGYAEGTPVAGRNASRKHFRINVFTMEHETITEPEFNARQKR